MSEFDDIHSEYMELDGFVGFRPLRFYLVAFEHHRNPKEYFQVRRMRDEHSYTFLSLSMAYTATWTGLPGEKRDAANIYPLLNPIKRITTCETIGDSKRYVDYFDVLVVNYFTSSRQIPTFSNQIGKQMETINFRFRRRSLFSVRPMPH